MAISWTPLGAHADATFPSSPVTISGATLATGDIVLFLYVVSGYGSTFTCTINGISATQLASVNVSTNDIMLAFKASGNSGTTGNIVLTVSAGGSLPQYAANWFVITGEGT